MIDPDGMQAFGAGTSSGIPSFAPEFENEAFSYRGNPFDDLYYADPALEAQKGSGDVSAQGTGSAPTQSATSDDVASTADAPDNRYYNDQGQLITVEENNNPDRYFTVGLSTAGPRLHFTLMK